MPRNFARRERGRASEGGRESIDLEDVIDEQKCFGASLLLENKLYSEKPLHGALCDVAKIKNIEQIEPNLCIMNKHAAVPLLDNLGGVPD